MAKFPGAAGAMEKQSQTLIGVFSTFKDTISIALSDAFTPILPALKGALADITPVLGDAIALLAPALGEFLVRTLPLISSMVELLSPLLGIFVDLGGEILVALSGGLSALGGVALRLVEALAPLAIMIGDFLGQAIEELVKSGALDEIIKQFLTLVPVFIDLLIALLPVLPPLASLLTLVLKMQTPLLQLLALVTDLLITEGLAPALEAVAGAVDSLFEKLGPAIDFVTNISNWPELFSAAGEKGSEAFSDLTSSVGDFIDKVGAWFSELPGKIGSFLSSLPGIIVDAIATALVAALDALTFGLGVLLGALIAFPILAVQALFQLPTLLAEFWANLTSQASDAWDALVAFVPAALAAIGAALLALRDIIGGAFASAFAAAKQVVADGVLFILTFIASIPTRLSNLGPQMLAAGLALVRALFAGLSQAGGFVGDLASQITGAIKSLLNRVISGINSGIASVDDSLPGVSLPRIPQLASGGLTTAGGLASLHPRELVLPLDDQRVVNLLARALNDANDVRSATAPTAGEAPVFDVRVFIGERELTHIVDVQISERDRRTRSRVQAGAGRR